MGKCYYCNEKISGFGFKCKGCKNNFCGDHRLYENHECLSNYRKNESHDESILENLYSELAEIDSKLELSPKNVNYLLEKSMILVLLNRPGKAIEIFEEIIKISDLPKAWYEKGKLHLKLNNVADAVISFKNAVEKEPANTEYHRMYTKYATVTDEEYNKNRSTAHYFCQKGEKSIEEGDLEKSIEYLKKSLKYFEIIKDFKNKNMLLVNIGVCYSLLGDFESSKTLFESVLMYSKEIEDTNLEFACTHYLGTNYFKAGLINDSINFLERALDIPDKTFPNDNKVMITNKLGIIHLVNGNYKLAQEKFRECLSLSIIHGNLRDKAISQNNSGIIYRLLEQYNDAIRSFKSAFQYARSVGNDLAIGHTMRNIVEILLIQRNYSELEIILPRLLKLYSILKLQPFEKIIEEYIEAYSKKDWKLIEGLLEKNMDLKFIEKFEFEYMDETTFENKLFKPLFSDTEDAQDSIEILKGMLKVAEKKQDLFFQAQNLFLLGLSYADIHYNTEALQFLRKGLPVAEKINDKNLISSILTEMGVVLSRIGKIRESLNCFKRVLPIHRELEDELRVKMDEESIKVLQNELDLE